MGALVSKGLDAEALALEELSVGSHGAPTLGRAFEILRGQWRRGERSRELALHLAFLAWYLLLEPPYLTGFDSQRVPEGELAALFNEAHAHLLPRGAASDDAEAFYVIGLMAHLSPWLLGDNDTWAARSETYRMRYRELRPDGILEAEFAARGAYGVYFAGHSRLRDGY
jgi:hypothetical protein